MSKHVCLEGGLMHASGDVNTYCEDGSKKVVRLRMTPSGRQIMGFGKPKRNYTIHPVTEDETAQRELFSQSAALRKKVLKDQGLKATWLGRFQADIKAGTTNCCTLSGYVMSQAMHGHVSAAGQYQE